MTPRVHPESTSPHSRGFRAYRSRHTPQHRIEDGISAVRPMLPRGWFGAARCARGVEALRLYRTDYDAKNQVLRPHPARGWTSHAADAFRYLAMAIDETTPPKRVRRFVGPIVYRDTGWR